MFRQHLKVFMNFEGFCDKHKKAALSFLIEIQVRHLAIISASGDLCRRPVDWASDSSSNSLTLSIPTCLCISLNTKQLKI